MTQWQPIETAPKDGTKIVIWNKRYAFCPIAKWYEASSDEEADGWEFDEFSPPACVCTDGFVGWNEDIEDGLMPSHWMPLPEPPRSDLPDWDDAMGAAPDATGDLSSEEFVRKLRDDWPEPPKE